MPSPVVLTMRPRCSDFWIDKSPATCLQPGQRAFFVDAHQAAVAGDVSREDRRKASVNPAGCHVFQFRCSATALLGRYGRAASNFLHRFHKSKSRPSASVFEEFSPACDGYRRFPCRSGFQSKKSRVLDA
jgi:hypothetical protein